MPCTTLYEGFTIPDLDAATGDGAQALNSGFKSLADGIVVAMGSAAWGGITGTMADQTDLQTALNARLLLAGGTMTGPLVLDGGVAAGAQAISYAQAYQLVTGTAALLTNYNISTTVGAPPASGTIRFNNATQISATEMYMSVLASDGLDLTNFIRQMRVGDTMYLQDEAASANYQNWEVTVAPVIAGGYATIGISLLNSAGTGTTNFANALPTIIYGKAAPLPVNTDGLAEGATNKYFTTARVLAAVLTGWVVGAATTVLSTDTITQAIGKLQGQINVRSSINEKKGNVAGGYAAITGAYTAAVTDIGRVVPIGTGTDTITVPLDTIGAALAADETATITFRKIGTGVHTIAVSGAGSGYTLMNGAAGLKLNANHTCVVEVVSTTSAAIYQTEA